MTTNQVDTHSTLHKVLTEINDNVERLKFDIHADGADGTDVEVAENLDQYDVETLQARRSYLLGQVVGVTLGIESIDAALARKENA